MKTQERKFARRKDFNSDARDWFCQKHNLPIIPLRFLKCPIEVEGHRIRFGVFTIPDEETERCTYCDFPGRDGLHICLALYSQKEFNDSLLSQGRIGRFTYLLKTPIIFEELAHYMQYSRKRLEGEQGEKPTFQIYRDDPIENEAKAIALESWNEWQKEFPDRTGYL